MIGIKRGTVTLLPHKPEWDDEAQRTIAELKEILGSCARDVQHVGSTAIPAIKAKPIIDIAVAADSFDNILAKKEELQAKGFYYRPNKESLSNQLLFACGSHYDKSDDDDMQTHFIHVVLAGSSEWKNYISFRDYLNTHPTAAREYENLKEKLSAFAEEDGNRDRYVKGKNELVADILRRAAEKDNC